MIDEKEIEEAFKKLWPGIQALIERKIEESINYKVDSTFRTTLNQTVDQFVRKVAKDKLEEKRKELEEKIHIKVEFALKKILEDLPPVLAKQYAEPISEIFRKVADDLRTKSWEIRNEIQSMLEK